VNSLKYERRAIATGVTDVSAATPDRFSTPAVVEPFGGGDGLARLGPARDPQELEAAEQKRWMAWLAPPFMTQALSVGLVFATGKQWWLALGVVSVFATALILIRLILSSETNTFLDGAHRHVVPPVDPVSSAPLTAASGIAGGLS
jgi:hypothetical protein